MQIVGLSTEDFSWCVEASCALLQRPFQRDIIRQQFAQPHNSSSLIQALAELGIDTKARCISRKVLQKNTFPQLVWLNAVSLDNTSSPALLLQADDQQVLLIQPGQAMPQAMPLDAFYGALAHEQGLLLTTRVEAGSDPDTAILEAQSRRFGFSWFVPELLRHKRLWQEILLASLVIQLLALATPLFTQTIIDKVIVHRTQSTLFVVLIGMAVFIIFTSVLSWLRQCLVLHTGNRVDAVLGTAVFERLFKLPPLYFQHRPTGVISARLHGVETIREFIASAAVTLILDFPFLLIFVAIMLYYSVTLTAIVLGTMGVVALLSFLVAPIFQRRLQEQF